MAQVKFRTKASTQDLTVKEIKRGVEQVIEVSSVKPSKMSDQDVVITLSTPDEKWSGKAWRNIRGMADNRAIHLIQ